jgi:hypothetical protein
VLYVGGVYGGPEVTGSKIDLAIRRITALLGDAHVEDSGSLDIVFHVPGSVIGPDYQGVRTGRLSRRERLLQVQIAVPREIQNKEQSEIEDFVLDALRDAIRIAGPRFEKAKIPYPLEEYERSLARVQKVFSPN